jgi:aspartate racemase
MKTIGLIGGITWHSTLDYYKYMNHLVNEARGNDESAEILLQSVNYGQIKKLTYAGDWDGILDIIGNAAINLEKAGAHCVMLGANTMHHIAPQVAAKIKAPLIHIADATADAIKEKKIKTVALLGTRYTMQFDFFKDRLLRHSINTLIPNADGIDYVNNAIYEELGKGIFNEPTRKKFQEIITSLINDGAEGIILGCTEIPLLIKPEHSPVPVFDTTFLHAKSAVTFALS